MKKTKFFALAFAALTLGACSSDDLVEQKHPSVTPGEKGYVSVAVNLPSQPSSRANDNFDDGLESEYNVVDATLLVFSGATEDAAKFTGAYPLTLNDGTQLGGNITTTYQVTQQITKPLAAGDDIYALVMINSKKVLKGSAEAGWQILGNALTVGTTTVADVKGMNGNVTAAALTDDALGEGYFYMTNAPLYSVPGGVSEPANGAVTTLTKINAENIFSTAAEAEDNPAASIYVERGVAKVTVTDGGTAGQNGNLNYTINGWTLDMTNTASYAVRNVTGADWWTLYSRLAATPDYRFVGSVPVAAGLYRTYFGMDPNYNAPGTFNEQIGEVPAALTALTGTAYCLENTFDVDHQNQDQTTRVIVAATLTGVGGDANVNDFYVVNNNKDNVLNTAGLEAYVKKQYLENPTVYGLLTDRDNGLKDGDENKLTEADLDVTYSTSTASADVTIAAVTIADAAAAKFKGGAIPADLAGSGNADALATINEAKIAYYKGGVSYYPVMIQHFGDDQTPWTAGSVSYPTPNRDDNYLGRWGVLRNNWYEINVTGVKSIGSPVVPEVYGTPDDPVESWISVEINVLSWAKRTQSADL